VCAGASSTSPRAKYRYWFLLRITRSDTSRRFDQSILLVVNKSGLPASTSIEFLLVHRQQLKRSVIYRSIARLCRSFVPLLFVVAWDGFQQGTPALAADPDQAEQEQFFESKVRPLLLKHCVECHGSDQQDGELRLDRRIAITQGGGSGPVVVAGKPDESLLIRAIGYRDAGLQMPPDGKLDEESIAILTVWVKSGAHWPVDSESSDEHVSSSPAQRIDEMRQSHWAYRPLAATAPPELSSAETPVGAIDRFIIARLEQAGIAPSPPADRRTLIHRAYFTLVGLPPSYEEVESFVADESADAFARLVDRLLDSPHYGERWARHWLDIARYADTTGYMGGSRETRYPYAYTYRDYVIDAFNDDKPYDEFIVEQLAADLLPQTGGDQKSLAAMGFLTVGRRFMNRQHDIIDDRIDVVTRGLLGMTVACARCHDHKYDPIPTADYYSLYGVFASSEEPDDLPLVMEPQPSSAYEAFVKEQGTKQQAADKWLEELRVKTEEELRARTADYVVYVAKSLPQYKADDEKKQGKRGALRPEAARRWQGYLTSPSAAMLPLWSLWAQLASLSPDAFEQEAKAILIGDAVAAIAPKLLSRLRQSPPKTMVEFAQAVGDELEAVHTKWVQARREDPTLTGLPSEDEESLRQLLFADGVPTRLDTAQMIAHLDQGERNKHNDLLGKVKGVEVTHPGAPPRAMVMVDKSKPQEPVIFRRGQPGNRGDKVPRRFPQVLASVDGGKPFSLGSGRLEMAQAIAHPDNPLTARVIVNRIWQHQFGAGLVRTASDFGTRGEQPSHPELLDYLAAEFIADGWSIKRLQRRILLSAAWQQTSTWREAAHRVDPENRLLWHMPRRRMEFEPLRDRLLLAAGKLDLTVGGRSVMVHQDAPRRGLYAYIDREDVPGLLASFDLPSPDASQAIRAQTTVPQQALFLMNADFVIKQAAALAHRTQHAATPKERVEALYRAAIARDPDQDERSMALSFVANQGSEFSDENTPLTGLPGWKFGYGYWDDQAEAVHFTPLEHFSGKAWQGSAEFPDPKLSYLMISDHGGHPGLTLEQSAIRRWVSPLSGVIQISGTLKHPQDKGDGVRGRVVASRGGELGGWQSHNQTVDTMIERVEVQPGDLIDFIVDCRQSSSFDSFQWAPAVRVLESNEAKWGPGFTWDAAGDFSEASKQLLPVKQADPWVQLAQVLLLCNEFAFVD